MGTLAVHAELLAYINTTKNEDSIVIIERLIVTLLKKHKNYDVKEAMRDIWQERLRE